MDRRLMGWALAGSLAVAGALAARAASAQDAAGPGGGPAAEDDACPCAGGEGHGRMGPHHAMMMPEHEGMMDGGLQLGAIWRLDLSDAQRTQLRKLAEEFRKANWTAIGNLIDARARLRDVESTAQPDPKQVGAAYADVSKLRQALLEAGVQARNQAMAVLTPAQRVQLETWRKEGGQGRGSHGHGRGMMEP